MSKQDHFKTTHGLKLNVSETSPFPGYAAFSLGGVAGFFSIPQADMSVDIIFGDIVIGEHIQDTIEWFEETAREINAIGLRVIGCKDNDLRAYLRDKYGFQNIRDGVLLKTIVKIVMN